MVAFVFCHCPHRSSHCRSYLPSSITISVVVLKRLRRHHHSPLSTIFHWPHRSHRCLCHFSTVICRLLTPLPLQMSSSQLLCRTSQVEGILSRAIYLRRANIGVYVGIQEILGSKSNTSSSINRSDSPAARRRVKSTPASSFKLVYK